MAKKKKAEEHENLERWLVSYADFMTLLFATFVVLYALAQTDTKEFEKLESALRSAFAKSSGDIFDGQQGMLSGMGTDSVMEGVDAGGKDANPLMLEYISNKYEENAYEELKDEVEKLKLEGVETTIDSKGLTIKLPQSIVDFSPNSAELSSKNKNILFDIGKAIFKRFQIHLIKVEGYTDSAKPLKTGKYPSNWELSGARASAVINYFIDEFSANPKQFVAVGYSDTVPLKGLKPDNPKNRRVEIVIVRNRLKDNHSNDIAALLKKSQKINYVKYNYAKKDTVNIIENKDTVAPKPLKATKESIEIKNLNENLNHRLNSGDTQYTKAPDFVKE